MGYVRGKLSEKKLEESRRKRGKLSEKNLEEPRRTCIVR
jgi:hypothetical protein